MSKDLRKFCLKLVESTDAAQQLAGLYQKAMHTSNTLMTLEPSLGVPEKQLITDIS